MNEGKATPAKSGGSKIIKDPDLIDDPEALVGMFDCFKVVSVADFGAFLDWGFPKDLFVPWPEQLRQMKEGESYVVYIYKDDKGRMAASSKIDKFLNQHPLDIAVDAPVDLLICEKTDLGYKAVVNNAFGGLLYHQDVFKELCYGQRVEGFVRKVREDGKLDLSLQRTGYAPVGDLSSQILEHLKASGGKSPIGDKTPPEEIHRLFGVSKKKFKMALGLLYKERKIMVETDGIRLAAPSAKR